MFNFYCLYFWDWHEPVSYVSATNRTGMSGSHMYPRTLGLTWQNLICTRNQQDWHEPVSCVSADSGADMTESHMYPKPTGLAW